MIKIKKLFFILISCITCLILVPPSTVYCSQLAFSEEEISRNSWKVFPQKENVARDKIWTITFKYPIDKPTVNNSTIFVQNAETKLLLSEDGKQVKIAPVKNYTPGHQYLLTITNKVKSIFGTLLYNPTAMYFTIETSAIKIDETFTNQSIILKKGETIMLTLDDPYIDGGWSWVFASPLDNNILKITDHFFISIDCKPNSDGCPGKERWIIQAIEAGETIIDLKYLRPWEPDSLKDFFKLKVIVQ